MSTRFNSNNSISKLALSCAIMSASLSIDVQAGLREQLEQMKKLSEGQSGSLQAIPQSVPEVQPLATQPAIINKVVPVMNNEDKSTLKKEIAIGDAIFINYCKSAGSFITSKVNRLEGIRLDSTREDRSFDRYADRNWIDAGLPLERVGQEFIASFLDFYFYDSDMSPEFPTHTSMRVIMSGFKFVDVKQVDSSYLRYKLANKDDISKGMISEKISNDKVARYAVSVSQLGSKEDRKHWIAGSLVRMIDTKTKNTLGEYRSFSYTPPSNLPGVSTQNRSWANKQSCPAYLDIQNTQVRVFLNNMINY
jgi:hypothetical protein